MLMVDPNYSERTQLSAAAAKHLIFRVSWLIGRNGSNFVRSILRAAKKEKNLNVVSDQTGVLTSTPFVAKVCKDSVFRIMKNDPWPSGLYNVVPNGTTNWYEIAVRLLSLAEEMEIPLSAASSIKPIKAADYITDIEAKIQYLTILKSLPGIIFYA